VAGTGWKCNERRHARKVLVMHAVYHTSCPRGTAWVVHRRGQFLRGRQNRKTFRTWRSQNIAHDSILSISERLVLHALWVLLACGKKTWNLKTRNRSEKKARRAAAPSSGRADRLRALVCHFHLKGPSLSLSLSNSPLPFTLCALSLSTSPPIISSRWPINCLAAPWARTQQDNVFSNKQMMEIWPLFSWPINVQTCLMHAFVCLIIPVCVCRRARGLEFLGHPQKLSRCSSHLPKLDPSGAEGMKLWCTNRFHCHEQSHHAAVTVVQTTTRISCCRRPDGVHRARTHHTQQRQLFAPLDPMELGFLLPFFAAQQARSKRISVRSGSCAHILFVAVG
jgi:hypothetical protein